MKKVNKVFLTILVFFSCFSSFIFPNTVKALASTYTYAYVNTDDLLTRTCPSTSCAEVRHDEGGIIYLNNPRVVEILEFSGNWAKVRYNYWGFTYTGYMWKDYLGGIKTVTLDANYANSLVSKGFPDSYVEKLTKMHAIHPNWNFEVSKVGTTLDNATNEEYSPIYKNLISTTNKDQLSTDPSTYSNGNYTEWEPGWYAPSKQTLSYYLDARNFLDDNSIFMFEQLSYDSSQTEETVQSILDGSFMAGSYLYNGQTWTYAKTFVEAGKKYGVSPVHLAARVMQEQGTTGSGTSEMVSDGKTYYNYFNFNASGSTTAEIIANALSYAKRWGWDSPYKAIFGGAEDISDGYITNNQDTLFYQKFNLVGYSSKYSNQYMANIQAPYSEGYTTYISYFRAGLTNSKFTFKIPVYDGMGAGTYIATKSNNNNLKNLSVSNFSLYPAFDSGISTYSCDVSSSTTKVTINAEVADTKASIVSGTGSHTLTAASTEITVKVKAEDGTTKDYKITVKRKEASNETVEDIISTSGYNNKDTNISGIKIGSTLSDVITNIKNNYPNAVVKMYDSNKKEINSGIVMTGQKMSISYNGKTSEFNIIVYGDTNGDGKITIGDYAKIKSQILGKIKMTGAYLESADTNKDGKITIGDYAKVKSYIQGKITRIE